MKRGHLVHRGTRGRTIAWARIPSLSDGRVTSVQYRLFLRLSTTGATVSELHVFPLEMLASAATGGRKCIADHLRGMRAQLKWRDTMRPTRQEAIDGARQAMAASIASQRDQGKCKLGRIVSAWLAAGCRE